MESHRKWEAGRGSPAQQLKTAESRFWDHYGLEPVEHLVEINDPTCRLRIQEVGSGVPVLFIHGTGGSGAYFAPLLEELTGYRCMALDRPGWGGSDPVEYPDLGYGAFIAGLLAQLLDALDIGQVHVIGASIGNTWALRLATEHPDRVASVALLGGAPLVPEIQVPRFIKLLRSPLGHVISRVRFTGKMETNQSRGLGHGPSLDDGRMPDAFVNWKVEMSNTTEWRKHERDMVRSIVGRHGWKPGLTFTPTELSAITVPVLMLFGTEDPVGSPETWRTFTDYIPNSELTLIQDAGHLLWFDQTDQVALQLTNHLAQIT